jgi:sterol desaturase/sphingolipid hydroxylase (fatty acid hydroxylase superfamily)
MLIVLALIVAALIAGEAIATRRMRSRPYEGAEVQTNIGIVAGWAAAAVITVTLTRPLNAFAFEERLGNLGLYAAAPVVLIIVADFLYYWLHRCSHEINWLWASHIVHHSATRMNFLTTYRQAWTTDLSGGALFWLPLGVLGFSPETWSYYFLTHMFWEIFIHNEWTGRLGVLEYVLVTPSHHRVHHSHRQEHLDRNYGGLFIVWDRLFGTFVDEGAVRLTSFGLVGQPKMSTNPIVVAFQGWRGITADFRAAPNWSQAARVLIAPPGSASFAAPTPTSASPASIN